MTGPVPVARQELPIPEDVQPGQGWSPVMIAMADHIGAFDVLRLCDTYGGQAVYFPQDPAKAPFVDVLGREKAERLSAAFRLEKITLPTGRYALSVARRAGVLASVRAGGITIAEAAALLRMRRNSVSTLLKSGEAQGYSPSQPAIRKVDSRQLEMFPGD